MPSPQFEAILDFLNANPTPPDLPFETQRQAMANLAAQTPLPPNIYTESIQAGTVPGLLVAAEGAQDNKLVLYLHGGGYCLGSSLIHRDFGWRLSTASRARVLLLDYRLAPENPFPAAVEDVKTAYAWLLANGLRPPQIAFGGDSAGGGLAVAAMAAVREDGGELPATAVCLSPWFDLAVTGKSAVDRIQHDPMLTPERLHRFARAYLGEIDPRTPLASPLFADLSGLPPLLIQVGTAEILFDDAFRLAKKAEKDGVDVTLDVWQDMVHVWHGFAAVVPEAQEAIAQIGGFIRAQLAGR